MDGRRTYRKKIRMELERLTKASVNDAIKLAYLDQEGLEDINGLDLRALTEFKRNANGTVEIKLIDRIALLERLLALEEEGRETEVERFFRGLAQDGAGDGT